MLAEVEYRGYGPSTMLHIIYCMVSAQQANLSECEGRKNLCINAIFYSSLSHLYGTLQ